MKSRQLDPFAFFYRYYSILPNPIRSSFSGPLVYVSAASCSRKAREIYFTSTSSLLGAVARTTRQESVGSIRRRCQRKEASSVLDQVSQRREPAATATRAALQSRRPRETQPAMGGSRWMLCSSLVSCVQEYSFRSQQGTVQTADRRAMWDQPWKSTDKSLKIWFLIWTTLFVE